MANAIARWEKLVTEEMALNGGNKMQAIRKVKTTNPAAWQAMTFRANRGRSAGHVEDYLLARESDDKAPGGDNPGDQDDEEADDDEGGVPGDTKPFKAPKKTAPDMQIKRR